MATAEHESPTRWSKKAWPPVSRCCRAPAPYTAGRDKLERVEECLLLIKACADDYPALERRLLALHPYDVPELLALPVLAGNPAYLAWLEADRA